MARVYLGLGSNINDRIGYLKQALDEIEDLKDTKILKSSSIYETEPWGHKEQNSFLNLVVLIETSLSPLSLIAELKDIEIKCGRIKRDKWFEREIDIDILFFDDIILKSELLEIPHPQMQNRRFVLVPLNEIEPDFIHPLLNVNMRTLLETGIDKSEVKLYKDKI